MADEVYQENVYLPGSKFFSFKKVLMDLGTPYNQMEMGTISNSFSFHSSCFWLVLLSLVSFCIERLAWRVSFELSLVHSFDRKFVDVVLAVVIMN